jgi:hypothetical protein
MVRAEGLDLGVLDRGEVGGVRGVLGPDHAAGQQGQPLLAGPPRGSEAGAAVPDPLGQPGRVRLDPVGELLGALDAAERAGRLAPDQPDQPEHPLVAEVLQIGGVGVEGAADVGEVPRRSDADAGVDPSPGQDVDSGQILGQPQRVLPAERGDGGAQLDAAGALGGGGQHRDR